MVRKKYILNKNSKIREKYKNKRKSITAYKVVIKERPNDYKALVRFTPLLIGENVIEASTILTTEGNETYSSGFHCFLSENSAKKYKKWTERKDSCIIAVKINPKDVVVVGENEVTFSKKKNKRLMEKCIVASKISVLSEKENL